MKTRLTKITNTPAIDLLRAIGMPENLQGLALALPALRIYIDPACSTWSTTPANAWDQCLKDAMVELSIAMSSKDELGNIFDKPTQNNDVYSTILKSKTLLLETGAIYKTYAVMGRAILIAAQKKMHVSPVLISRMSTLHNAILGKGRRAQEWELFATINLTNLAELKEFRDRLGVNSPVVELLEVMIHVLETPVLPPEEITRNEDRKDNQKTQINQTEEKYTTLNESETSKKNKGENFEELADEDEEPGIGARLKGADYMPFSTKLGLHHRDQLLLDDLTPITRGLMVHMHSKNKLNIGFAMLALISLITCSSDTTALKLEFEIGKTIWIDLSRSCWAWDFQVYRNSQSMQEGDWDESRIEPIYIPFPVTLSLKLQELKNIFPDAKNLKQLILDFIGQANFDLKAYRQFLRGCSPTQVHPAYQGRFSRTLPSVYLEVTGSDMTSGLTTGHLAAMAPAALYYFGASYRILKERIRKVYARLGLGDVAELSNIENRIGCQNVLEIEKLKLGWSTLTHEINMIRRSAFASKSKDELIKNCNEWMKLIAAGFVIQSGHRGTRLECLTFGALLLHPNAMLIQDKDEAGHVQPRLLPRNHVINELLMGALECHQLSNDRAESRQNGLDFLPQFDSLLFAQWAPKLDSPTSAISTRMIGEITLRHFQAAANFGRSQWVSYLDEFNSDRWLIRVLTGHARDVTRTNGAYLDVPPIIAANRLGVAMDNIGSIIFGTQKLEAGRIKKWDLPTVIETDTNNKRELSDRVLDPRTLLAPLTASTLAGWKATETVRQGLTRGEIEASKHVLAVLHLIFIDQIPDVLLCLIAACEPDRNYFKKYGEQEGVVWQREHFIHDTWLPIQPTTTRLLDMVHADKTQITHLALMSQVHATLKNIKGITWPREGLSLWHALADITQAWRRIEVAPHMAILTNPTVPTPCLSRNSLRRLAGEKVIVDSSIYQPAGLVKPAKLVKGEDLRDLTKILNKYSSSLERLGEKRQRAMDCMKTINALETPWSSFGMWMRDWILDELGRTKNNVHGCYQISSLSTYLCTLLLASEDFDQGNDPNDWEDEEWLTWVKMINSMCRTTRSASQTIDTPPPLEERAKNALNAFIYSLSRREENVPRCVFQMCGVEQISKHAGSSASSTLITDLDAEASLELLLQWHQESPVDSCMDKIRNLIGTTVPVRAADISSLKRDCLTPAGGLGFVRVGYNHHKNSNSLRVVKLDFYAANSLEVLIANLYQFIGDEPLLMRGSGTFLMGLRDQRLAKDFGSALKAVTGDPHARAHSLRASTLQKICWPSWDEIAGKLMHAEASVSDCHAWVEQLQTDWTRCAKAISMAGHGDLRSALGNYMASWPLVFGIQMNAKMIDLEPGPKLLVQLGLHPDSLRQERSRAKHKGKKLCSWSWISKKIQSQKNHKQAAEKIVKFETKNVAHIKSSPSPTPSQSPIIYLTLRALSLTHEKSLEKSGIQLSLANHLYTLLPDFKILDEVAQRARTGPQERGKAANIAMALSPTGAAIRDWLSSLDKGIRYKLKQSLFRETDQFDEARDVNFWQAVIEKIPSNLHIKLRIGAAYLHGKLQADFLSLYPALLLFSDPRIGAIPIVSIAPRESDNRVLVSRISSVTRASVLAFTLLQKNEVVENES